MQKYYLLKQLCTNLHIKIKLQIWDGAKREASRRRKFDWGDKLGS